MTTITDGAGKGYSAQVDDGNRLHVHSLTRTESASASLKGDAFMVNTGELTLTGAGESAIIFLEFTDPVKTLVISDIEVGLSPTTGGSAFDIPIITIYRNPTGGTIVSDATAVAINANRSFSSASSILANIYSGGQGKTISGGTVYGIHYQAEDGHHNLETDNVLTKGNCIAVSVTPASGNTSMTCYTNMLLHINGETL